MLTIDEIPDSRSIREDPAQIVYRYLGLGENDPDIVYSYALGSTPSFQVTNMGILYRQDIDVAPRGHQQHIITVPYAAKKRNTGEWTFNFDTSGATVKVKVAREHIASYDESGVLGGASANMHRGAIGVKPDGDVEGVDIVIPALKLNVQYKNPRGVVTIAYAKTLARATGCANSAPFLDFAPGELLFVGAQGSDGTETDAEVTYMFVASENTDSLSMGDVANIVKYGHHYAWAEFKDAVVGGQAAVQVKRVHVERVYNFINFANYLGWGS